MKVRIAVLLLVFTGGMCLAQAQPGPVPAPKATSIDVAEMDAMVEPRNGGIVGPRSREASADGPFKTAASPIFEVVKSQPLGKNVRGLAVAQDGTLTVVGYDGYIGRLDADLKSLDPVSSGISLPLHAVAYINALTGFAVGGADHAGGTDKVPGPVILRTDDGGKTWERVEIPYQWSELADVAFFGDTGFAMGQSMALRSADRGKTWSTFNPGARGGVLKILRQSDRKGVLIGLDGSVVRTEDAGETWQAVPVPGKGHLYCGHFPDPDNGFVAGQMEMMTTKDGGQTWELLKNSPSEIYELWFATPLKGYAFGRAYSGGCFGQDMLSVYRTLDGGKSWEMQRPKGMAGAPEKIIMLSPDSGVGVGGGAAFTFRLH